jgi:hypothetical protein
LVPKKHALTMYYLCSVYSQKDMQLLNTWPPPPSKKSRLTTDMEYCLFTIVLGCLVLIHVVEPGKGGIPCHSTRLLLNLTHFLSTCSLPVILCMSQAICFMRPSIHYVVCTCCL